MRLAFLLSILWLASSLSAQFSPDGGQQGSIAIHQDSAVWKGFATELALQVGWLDASDTTLGRIDFIVRDAGIGFPDLEVQPLGDCGMATAFFAEPFGDQSGYDFVVFENGFATSDTTGFFELAFVEVSSNGVDFFRFPNVSLSTAEDFAGPFAELDSRLIDGLAGRFSAPYGAPFDLSDLPNDALLDKNSVSHIRIIDVVGTSNSAFAKTDSDGMLIIDPYPTAYNTGGFDLDAIGILGSEISSIESPPVFPQTSVETITVNKGQIVEEASAKAIWIDALGRVSSQGVTAPFRSGYFVVTNGRNPEKLLRVFVF